MNHDPRPVVVLGGTGMVGQTLVRELFYSGQQVRVACRRPVLPADIEPGDPVVACPCDITDTESLKPVLEGARAVINAVGLYQQHRDMSFQQVHVEGARQLASLARAAGVEQYLLISGIGARLDSPSPYVRSRAEGEQAVMAEIARAIILRPSVMYGPGQGLLTTLSRLARLPVIPLFGDGQVRLQPLHVSDLANAISRLTARPNIPLASFELGGPDVLSWRQLVRLVADHLDRDPRLVPIPMALWHALAIGLSPLPSAPLTRDMLWLLAEDNTASPDVAGFAELGITPRTLRESLPNCLPR
ncbi:complex I NDUFA9 subunit family protein [Halomonas cupida]|uniref:complex I NDUFA9 subunit family protein n=1 Tax=Halomonas cupida TaxID=44933 RepID=UPI0039B4DE57